MEIQVGNIVKLKKQHPCGSVLYFSIYLNKT